MKNASEIFEGENSSLRKTFNEAVIHTQETKIKEPIKKCNHPEHKPANMKYREAGTYKHTCPSCKEETLFEVPLITC